MFHHVVFFYLKKDLTAAPISSDGQNGDVWIVYA
jgi:hypothetical protein